MSGQLVGEVLDARAERLADLSQAQTLALVAIAEKCHADSRQGSVRLSHIQAAIGKSQRTTVRTLEQLKDRELIRVVKRGYKSHGVARASIYELSALTPPKVAQPTSGAYATQDGATNGHVLTPNPDVLTPSMGGVLDGSIDGSIDGREARACASGEPLDVETVPDPGNALSLISNLSEQQNNVIDAELVDNEPDDPEPTATAPRTCPTAPASHAAPARSHGSITKPGARAKANGCSYNSERPQQLGATNPPSNPNPSTAARGAKTAGSSSTAPARKCCTSATTTAGAAKPPPQSSRSSKDAKRRTTRRGSHRDRARRAPGRCRRAHRSRLRQRRRPAHLRRPDGARRDTFVKLINHRQGRTQP